ncbi:BglG family transcription antiterminator [Jeotgalibacillus haloalkalitolerans]|uniref:Ascorbate-specific PTS system EIIA component n=1 Tax=Jeotgalibacillus haloalkalitolerans TaxID=3104292 RepID=A0ABU5KJ78_9BACL|nr:BglG family transcription antiterminator [Jeotgalibacillus sp. HH7-29]MDZ5710775.1 BglG family transcription antiterminator [Jeotgalibacillus sp. HH7-29]
MLDQKSYEFLERLTQYQSITKPEMMMELNLTERQFDYLLEKANSTLTMMKLPTVGMHNQVLVTDDKVRAFMKKEASLTAKGNDLIVSEEDRPLMIYLYTFIKQEMVSGYHYQLLLNVSKNTALTDVKKTKELCREWHVQLEYQRMNGYIISGTEMNQRRFAIYCINTLLSKPLGKEILITTLRAWNQDHQVVEVQKGIDRFLKGHPIQLVRSRKVEMMYHFIFIKARLENESLHFEEDEKTLLEDQEIFSYAADLANLLFPQTAETEKYFVGIQLLTCQEELNPQYHAPLRRLAEKIIDEFEKNTLLPIRHKAYLVKSLFNHLVPTFFRITFSIPLINPMTEKIKEDYHELFQFVEKSLYPLEIWTGKKISEAEIGYFTLHFGGYLENHNDGEAERVKALIVCSNGVSSSVMLRSQLSELFPGIDFSSVYTAEHIDQMSPENYDLIFSTVPVESEKPVYQVKPLLSIVEKSHLIQAVASAFPQLDDRNLSVEQIMQIVRRNADVKNEKKLISELVELLYAKNTEKRWEKPMLSELLTEENIHFTNEELDWKTAIRKAAEPLVETETVEPRYVEAMISNVEEVGAYIHIGKGIAIPHARPDAGVNQVGMSFLRTREPVKLLDQEEHSIDVFVCLAAVDNEAHLKALAHLTKILGNDEALQMMKNATSAEEIINIIKEGEE